VTEHGRIDWDEMYAASERVWSGNPNGALVAEVGDLTPGTAVDIGCGEGADAIWLAQQGWRVTALDVSGTALSRAAAHVADAGVSVRLVHAGLLDAELEPGSFDLVSAQYAALLREDGRSLAALLALVAPGGTLLVVHHAEVVSGEAFRPDFDPADYVLPGDVHEALVEGWDVQVYGERPRHVTTGAGAGHTTDLVLRARRAGAPSSS
jgi:SAM-dependent methyltransferase